MSAKNESALNIKKAWELSKRGFGIISKLFPGFLAFTSIKAVLVSMQPLVMLYMSSRIIDELTGLREVSVIVKYAAIAVLAKFALAVAQAIVGRKLSAIYGRQQIKQYCFHAERYLDFDFEHVEKLHLNELIEGVESRISGNGLGLWWMLLGFETTVQSFMGVVSSCVLLVGIFTTGAKYVSGFVTSPWATLSLCILVLTSVFVNILIRNREEIAQREISTKRTKSYGIMKFYSNYVLPSSAAKDIRLYSQDTVVMSLLEKYMNISLWNDLLSLFSRTNGATAALNALAGGGVYLLVGLRALAGMYSIGSVVKYVGAITGFVNNVTILVGGVAGLYTNAQYLEPLYEYLDMPDVKYLGTLTTEKRTDSEYELEFHNVSFRYPGTDKYALRNFSLKLKIGQKLAVVGMNGSGKTTMIKLLTRLYDPTEGRITLNGFDISKYDYDEYMDLFSVVFQDFSLFSLPLGQNVAASVEVDEQRAKECLERAGFGERLAAMPKGLETCLHKDFDKDGVELSGGEAQKVALARALYKNAPVVVLDEPTAALDPIAEFEVYSRFDEIVGDKTAIFISHRLSSCRFCNDIAVFHEGELIQRGSHDELVADASGKYHELWHAQAQYYTNE